MIFVNTYMLHTFSIPKTLEFMDLNEDYECYAIIQDDFLLYVLFRVQGLWFMMASSETPPSSLFYFCFKMLLLFLILDLRWIFAL